MPTPRSRLLLLGRVAEASPVFVAKSESSFASTATVTVTVPSGVQDGDLLIAFVAPNTQPTITAPNGWTLGRVQLAATSREIAWYWRIAASEPASYDWTLGVASPGARAMLAYRPVAGSPIDAEAGSDNNNSAFLTAPAISPAGPRDVLIAAYCLGSGATISTTPTGMTSRVNSANTARLLVYEETLAAAGATGARTGTLGGASVNAGVSIAIRGR